MKLIYALSLFVSVGVLSSSGCDLDRHNRRDSRGVEPGYPCTLSPDCAEGCYCGNGICEEAGFCTSDDHCGPGFRCNVERSSCEPVPPGCKADSECDQSIGEVCDIANAKCTIGSCAGAITCTTVAPTCSSGSSPLIFNGCYTGHCLTTTQCTEAPTCERVNDETNCLTRGAECTAVYVGLNCTNSQTGQACHSGDSGCVCESFQFDRCKTTNPPPM